MYRWLDAEGRTHFGSQPPPAARQIQRVGGSASRDPVNIVPGLSDAPATEVRRRPETPAARTLRELEEQEPKVIAGRSESQWRKEMLRRERAVEKLEEDLEYAEDQLSSAYALGRASYYQSRVNRLRSQLESARRALDELEDRARSLGVPPGWLR